MIGAPVLDMAYLLTSRHGGPGRRGAALPDDHLQTIHHSPRPILNPSYPCLSSTRPILAYPCPVLSLPILAPSYPCLSLPILAPSYPQPVLSSTRPILAYPHPDPLHLQHHLQHGPGHMIHLVEGSATVREKGGISRPPSSRAQLGRRDHEF